MNVSMIITRIALFLCLGSVCLGAQSSSPAPSFVEKHFPTLKIGTETYTNVTVTTANKSYVMFLHSSGMMNVKVSALSDEEKELLGYQPKPSIMGTNSAKAVVAATLKKMEATPQLQEIEKSIIANTAPNSPLDRLVKGPNSLNFLIGFGVVLLLMYLFSCYCCKLICLKSGSEPGVLIWIPILQMFPLLRAAKMSPLWFIAMLLPILNLVAHILWCVRISQARGKGVWTIIGLLLPITNIIAFLYLAFSDSENDERDDDVKIHIEPLTASN